MTRTHELDHDRDHDDIRRTGDPVVAPGRGTRSQDLVGPTGPMPSGILMRKAHAGAGVADGAEAAVGRASSSSGNALPHELRGKFEGSLGTDLSSVRVHTGDDSAAAADAVGARAYTIGDAIHFGAGQYDPASSGGQHLLAHEVAHTVQQRGGSPHRQHKLAVSSAGDGFEAEADRAADAMTSGAPFALSSTPMTIARKEASAPAMDAGKGAGKDAGEEEGKDEKDKKPSWPKVKGSKMSGSFLGGTLTADWSEGGGVTQAWEKGESVKLDAPAIHQEFPIAPGVIGLVSGGFDASLEAKVNAAVAVSSKQAPPPYNEGEMMMSASASGGGSVEAKAGGFLKVGVGAGVANVLSISAGAKLALEASASIGVTVGGQIDAVQDLTSGRFTFDVTGKVDVKATGSVDIDVNAAGKSHNITSYTLGEFKIAEGIVSAGVTTAGGQLGGSNPTVKWKLLDLPPATERQTRPPTPEERAEHMPVLQGASGAEATGGPEAVPMSDTELADAGTKAALERLSPHVHRVVAVQDPGKPAGQLVSFELDGISYTSHVDVGQGGLYDDPDAKDTTRPVVRVLAARINAINAKITADQIKGAQTVGDVSAKILHDGYVAFALSPELVEFDKSPKEKREEDHKIEQQQRAQGKEDSQESNQSSDEQRDNLAPLPQSSVED